MAITLTTILVGFLGIAIDHFVGHGLAMTPPTAFTIPGSDHRGLRTTIRLPP